GATWTAQRRGGQRAAVLLLHGRPGDVPVESLALLGAEDGYLATAVRVLAPDPRSAAADEGTGAARLSLAVRQAGGAAAEALWQFPLPRHLTHANKGDVLRTWDRADGSQAAQQLLRQMVLALRTWRPDVVITDHPDPEITGSTGSALVAEAVH